MKHIHKNVSSRQDHNAQNAAAAAAAASKNAAAVAASAGLKERSITFDFNNSLLEQSQQQQCSIMMETKH